MIDAKKQQETEFHLSFEQYCRSLMTLTKYGTAVQQFEFVYYIYAMDSERGITRPELFELLRDHYTPPQNKQFKNETSERHFERLYTWVKKHIGLFDTSRSGHLHQKLAIEMLKKHPTIFEHFQLQLEPYLRRVDQNTRQYIEKMQAITPT